MGTPPPDLGDAWETGKGYLVTVALVAVVAGLLTLALLRTVG